jgi:hypothetical protein
VSWMLSPVTGVARVVQREGTEVRCEVVHMQGPPGVTPLTHEPMMHVLQGEQGCPCVAAEELRVTA